MSSTSTSADPLVASRNAANLRSIARSDPSVEEILETSTYSTIYHYVLPEGDPGGDGEWVKQKAEGPTFIVRRSKPPEHAIYILNRASVKNITIPLVKGEMKVTLVAEGMLQVARRGEKVKRGVWFSDVDAVPRFRDGILRICGLPSARPASALLGASPASAPAIPSPLPGDASSTTSPPNTASTDGFSRLFAGLMTSASGSPRASTPTLMPPVPPHAPSPSPHAAGAPNLPSVPPPTLDQVDSATHLPTGERLPVSSPPPSDPALPPPQPSLQPFAPGQTVDDLLNSILGVASPPPAPAAGRALPPPAPASHLPPPETAPPVPTATKPSHAPGAAPDSDSWSNAGTYPPPPPQPNVPLSLPPPPQPPTTHANGYAYSPHAPPPLPSQGPVQHDPHGAALRESVLDALGGVRDLRPGGKDGFVRNVEALLRTEPRFVDDLWQGYLRRIHQSGG